MAKEECDNGCKTNWNNCKQDFERSMVAPNEERNWILNGQEEWKRNFRKLKKVDQEHRQVGTDIFCKMEIERPNRIRSWLPDVGGQTILYRLWWKETDRHKILCWRNKATKKENPLNKWNSQFKTKTCWIKKHVRQGSGPQMRRSHTFGGST